MLYLLAGLASADTVVLDDPSVDPQPTLDALWATPGEHVVRLGPGVWNTRLVFDDDPIADRIVVGAADPDDRPVLMANSADGVLSVAGGEVVFRALTVVGGEGRGLRVTSAAAVTLRGVRMHSGTSDATGGCVHVLNQGSLTVDQSVFDQCQADHGGAIGFASTGRLEISNSAILRARAASSGGGVFINGGRLTVRTSVFSDNVAVTGSGGGIFSGTETVVLDTVFSANHAGLNGGGWTHNGGAPYTTVAHGERNVFIGNHAGNGGGGFIASGAATSIDDHFRDNTSEGAGGGLYAHLGSMTVSGAMFCRNHADGNGGAMVQNQAVTVVDRGVFAGNSSGRGGGFLGSSGSLTHATFVGNTATISGGHAEGGVAVVLSDSLVVGVAGDIVGPTVVGGLTGEAAALGFAPSSCVTEAYQPVCGTPADAPGVTGRIGALDTCVGNDADGDGVAQPADCDDTDADVFPGAQEVCNDGVDQDCDGSDLTGFVDADGDGHGGSWALGDCGGQVLVAVGGDCDDGDGLVFPTAIEVCNGLDDDCDGVLLPDERDADGDGAICADDCDDTNPNLHVDAPEVCDGIDTNCDGTTEDLVIGGPRFVDLDGDGWGAEPSALVTCPVVATSSVGGDCDDANSAANPAALEVCGNGVDDDCDGLAEQGPSVDGTLVAYRDADGDGIGAGPAVLLCVDSEGYVPTDGDCDDDDPLVSPGQLERCDGLDTDCNGVVDDMTWYTDGDGDGFGDVETRVVQCDRPHPDAVRDGTDCDDRDRWVSPAGDEICDGLDNDCDPVTPEGPVVFRAVDGDGDGFGDGPTVFHCLVDPALVPDTTDCNDADPADHPGAEERCDGLDNNCDGVPDDGWSNTFWLFDDDDDGFGVEGLGFSACSALVDPTLTNLDGDCDDADPEAYPGHMEVCDGIDNDCNDLIDDTVGFVWYADTDGDGYGDPAVALVECVGITPVGYVANSDDCDDEDGHVHPMGVEVCDGIDTDCDGDFDNPSVGATRVVFPDVDDDGYGDGEADLPSVCIGIPAPEGYVDDEGDCDDQDPAVNPLADEVCGGGDEDCSGEVDDHPVMGGFTAYADQDGDDFGAGAPILVCALGPQQAHNDDDCDDNNSLRYPGAPEICNGLDDDCEMGVDEDVQVAHAPGASEYFVDADKDGFGDEDLDGTWRCFPAVGEATATGDCDDGEPNIYPGAPEICDGSDSDCDGTIGGETVDWFVDADGDSYGSGAATSSCLPIAGSVTRGGDCEDAEAAINPGAVERCNGLDDDCDNQVDDDPVDTELLFVDADDDGFGDDQLQPERVCPGPLLVEFGGDCDDTMATRSPLVVEVCDGVDNDCNGAIDDNAVSGFQPYWIDVDGDGFGVEQRSACEVPAGAAMAGGDCDDGNPHVNPGRLELCNGVDDDCVDGVDLAPDVGNAFWPDRDVDGAGAADEEVLSCLDALEGHVRGCEGDDCVSDCDDTDGTVGPLAEERCNGRDDDCDGEIDNDAVDQVASYLDVDGDGVAGGTSELVCPDAGLVLLPGPDCDDMDADIAPNLPEVCDDEAGHDEDCNGLVNAEDPACVVTLPPPPDTGCACANDGGMQSVGWGLVVGLLGLVRRRAS